MEVGQADQVAKEKEYYVNKQYGRSLAKAKVVYARDEDPSDTVVIRNLYPNISDGGKVFGMKDVDVIRKVFCAIIKLISFDLKRFRKRIKYAKKEDFDQLENLIKELEDEIIGLPDVELNNEDDTKSLRLNHGVASFIRITIASKADFPYIKLCNEDTKQNCNMYLFIYYRGN